MFAAWGVSVAGVGRCRRVGRRSPSVALVSVAVLGGVAVPDPGVSVAVGLDVGVSVAIGTSVAVSVGVEV